MGIDEHGAFEAWLGSPLSHLMAPPASLQEGLDNSATFRFLRVLGLGGCLENMCFPFQENTAPHNPHVEEVDG